MFVDVCLNKKNTHFVMITVDGVLTEEVSIATVGLVEFLNNRRAFERSFSCFKSR
jgi:hypothetical protein